MWSRLGIVSDGQTMIDYCTLRYRICQYGADVLSHEIPPTHRNCRRQIHHVSSLLVGKSRYVLIVHNWIEL